MTFTSSEVEASVRTLLEAASWIDWWFSSACSLVMTNLTKEAKHHQLFFTGAQA